MGIKHIDVFVRMGIHLPRPKGNLLAGITIDHLQLEGLDFLIQLVYRFLYLLDWPLSLQGRFTRAAFLGELFKFVLYSSYAFFQDFLLLWLLALFLQLLILLRKLFLYLFDFFRLDTFLVLSDPIVINVAFVVLVLCIFLVFRIRVEKNMAQLHAIIFEGAVLVKDKYWIRLHDTTYKYLITHLLH